MSLGVRDLIFTGDAADSPIVGVLPITKNRKRSYTYVKFSKGVDISVCRLNALMRWLCVLRAHGVADGNIFVQVTSNVLQGGTVLDGATYGRIVRSLGDKCGVQGLVEHSARRGEQDTTVSFCATIYIFLYITFSWESLTEMMKYIGIKDVHNSYALLGFTAFGTNELSHAMTLSLQ